jgi:arginine decarboxylase
MSDWSHKKSLRTYNIKRWGNDYFNISSTGHLLVAGNNGKHNIDLCEVAELAQQSGLSLPFLARFPRIIHQRVNELCQAFDHALNLAGVNAIYTPVYPIKVNQNRNVVEEILNTSSGRAGLEAGSKPELLAVLALSHKGGTIICNGYKDRDYIRLALAGLRMGLRVYLVIEKLSELNLIIKESKAHGIQPLIGIRLKLASVASGKWQNSGGDRSKFGLTSSQLLTAIEQLKAADMISCLQLLHIHLGSQISNIRDIQTGMGEASQFLVQLAKMHVDIKIVDIGGGLGVDYEGTASRSECSVNYTVTDYAAKIVGTLKHACKQHKIKMPDIFSESGRALVAHHAVLITNVTEVEKHDSNLPGNEGSDLDSLSAFQSFNEALDQGQSLHEVYADLHDALQEMQLRFNQGRVKLCERAKAEQFYYQICSRLLESIDPANPSLQTIAAELKETLADKVFCNFSLFQSMPDVWAIDQIFPIVPLQRLNEEPANRAILHDLTCDSDGRIDLYVDQHGIENTLALHDIEAGEKYLLGFFMVGAYQETLGDIHNLFGDTSAANVILNEDGSIRLEQLYHGEDVDQLLSLVEYDPVIIRQQILKKAQASSLTEDEREELMAELQTTLQSYSYLVH